VVGLSNSALNGSLLLKPNIQSIIGKYVINGYDKGTSLLQRCSRLKKENPLKYFIVMSVFFTIAAAIGIKVKGFYLMYLLFWIVFFIPAIIHYDMPRRLLNRLVPILYQLDRSMKYERRSIIDKKELLVDVKLPSTDADNDEIEDELLESFKPNELKSHRKLKGALDEEEEDEFLVNTESSTEENSEGEEEEEEVEDEDTDERHSDIDEEDEEIHYDEKIIEYRVKKPVGAASASFASDYGSLMPNDETIPDISQIDVTQDYEEEAILVGDKVKMKKYKIRPSVFNAFANSSEFSTISPSTSSSQQPSFAQSLIANTASALANTIAQNYKEKDIDDSFDFLEEELKKIDNH